MLQITQHAAKSTASSPKKDFGSIRSGTCSRESSPDISPCRRQLLDMHPHWSLVSMHQRTSSYLARPLQVSTLCMQPGAKQSVSDCRHDETPGQ